MHNHTIKRSIAACAVIAAAGFPSAAQAMPIGGFEGSVPVSPPVTAPSISTAALGHRDAGLGEYRLTAPAAPSAAQSGSSFDWGDAGIGAASMIALLGIGAGATVMARSRQRHDVVGG